MATRAADLQRLERVRARVAEAATEEDRTGALWSRLAGLVPGGDARQLAAVVRGYVEGVPPVLAALQAAAGDPVDGARASRLVDVAAEAFLSTPGLPGEAGVIGLLANAHLVWQLVSLASRDDPEPLAPQLVQAHELVGNMLGPELAARHDRIAAQLLASTAAGGAAAPLPPGAFAAGVWRALPPPRIVALNVIPATPPSVRTTVFAEGDGDAVPAGGLDPRFGRRGVVVSGVPEGEASALAVGAGGALVVAGRCANDRGTRSALVARYGSDGALDPTFGRTGCLRIDRGELAGAPLAGAASGVALQADGAVVIVGSVRQPPERNTGLDDLFAARFTPDGALDASFGGGGFLQLDAGMASAARGVLIEPDGSIVVTGSVRDARTGNGQACVLRLTAHGDLSPTLGAGGIALLPSEGAGEGIALARLGDGRLTVLSREAAGLGTRFVVWRVGPDGRPDPRFGDGGRTALELGTGSNEPRALAVEADGSCIVAGYLDSREYVLLRLDAAGRLDPRFGDGGVVTGLFERPADVRERPASFGAALAVQEDGAILLAGALTQRRVSTGWVGSMPTYDVDRAIAMARFLPGGRLDPEFGAGGVAITDVSDGVDELLSVALAGDRIVAAGTSARGLLLAGLLRDASSGAPAPAPAAAGPSTDGPAAPEAPPRRWLDASFGAGGAVFCSFAADPAEGRAVALQPDGRIVVVGRVGDPEAGATELAAARLERDGALDARFGAAGRKVVEIKGASGEAHAVALQADGAIVVAGSLLDGEVRRAALVRLHPDGRVDGSFGGGLVTAGAGAGGDAVAHAVAIQADGTIVTAGYAADASSGPGLRKERFLLTRHRPDGRLDETFGAGGIVTAAFQGDLARARAVRLQQDGALVVAGFARHPAKEFGWDLAVARLLPDGSLDPSFGTAGRALVDVERTNDLAHAVALQPDGRIVLAGVAADPEGAWRHFLLARLDAAGQLDRGFGSGGIVLVRRLHGAAAALAPLPDGRLLAAGHATDVETGRDQLALACCLPDGRLDAAFGDAGVLLVDLGGELDGASGLAVQEDGRVIVAGTTRSGGAGELVVVRVHLG